MGANSKRHALQTHVRLQVGNHHGDFSASCHLKAADVFRGLPDAAFLASRLASMAAQSASRSAKAVTTEYAWLPNSSGF